MAQVMLRAPLSELCGGRVHTIAGWVLDERGRIREHVNVFVNGIHGEEGTPLAGDDRVHVLPAITGG